MKRISLFLVALLIVAVAVLASVAIDVNEADAYSNGWAGGCGGCHGGSAVKLAPAAHNVAAHQVFWTTCTNCHASVPGDSPAAGKCGGCHGGVIAIAAKPTHTAAGCAVPGCHASTTTTQSTTTTTGGTTSTTGGTTSTTGSTTTTTGSTTTTAGSTTTTTLPPPTTTTLPPPTTTTTSTSTTTTSSTTSTTLPPPHFSDVLPDHPYHGAILAMAAAGVVDGYEEPGGLRTFRPDNTILRQQFAKMIVEAIGVPVSEADVCPFPDVDQSGPVTLYPDNFVAAAALRKITQGTSIEPPRFSPWREISRAQVLTMVVRAASSELPGRLSAPPASFSGTLPAEDPTHGANTRTAEWNGLLNGIETAVGTGLTEWDIWAPATRGEVAQVLWNLTR